MSITGPHQEPAWLTAKVDQRLALIQTAMLAAADSTDPDFVMTYLDEGGQMSDEERERWERTCDNCGRYCAANDDFWTGHVLRQVEGRQVMLAFGVCADCKDQT